MCRMAAYIGPAVPLSTVLYDPPHSLERQAYAPRELLHGTVNVDGTGVVWWDSGDPEPRRYVSDKSPWADPNLPTLAHQIRSETILAAVRSATAGLGHGASEVAPFARGTLAAAHNGHIAGFRGPIGRELIGRLPESVFGDLDVVNDSRVLFLLLAARRESGAELRDAMLDTLSEIRAVCRAHSAMATLNVIATDGTQLVAVRTSEGGPINSLYTAQDGASALIVSEPLDDTRDWNSVPDHALVETNGSDFKFTNLEDIT